MSETTQPPKDESADTPIKTKEKGRVFEFLSSLPGLLTAIAATITAIGGLYLALKPHSKAEPADKNTAAVSVPTPSPSPGLKEMRLKRHERAWATDHVEIELVDVENLKGKGGKGEPSSQRFNNSLDDCDRIFSKILSEAGVSDQTAQTVREMTQDEWDKFLDSLNQHQKEIIETTPFAKFNVY